MKKGNLLLRCLLVLLCLPVSHVFAQQHATAQYPIKDPVVQPVPKNKPMDAFIQHIGETNTFVQVSNIWQADNTFDQTILLQQVQKAQPLTIDYAAVSDLIRKNTTAISLVVPGIGGGTYTIDLAQYNYLANSFQVHNMDGNTETPYNYTPGKYYSGIVHGIPGSVAAFSFFNNQVFGIFSIPGVGNMVLVPNSMVGNYYDFNQHYLLYNDKDLKILDHAPKCATDALPDQFGHTAERTTTTLNNNVYNNCKEVRVMEVADYATYLTNGSSNANVTNYVTALFNNQATLYRNEGILIVLNYLQINSTTDQYQGITTASSTAFLTMFGAVTQNTYKTAHNCDLAILLATNLNGGYGALGGVAWLQSACANYQSFDSFGAYSFCDLDNGTTSSVLNFPTYSWDVEVLTHEMGHQVGSPHTHRCCWFPPGTGILPIDGCYATAGGAMEPNPPAAPTCAIPTPALPPGGGTIMSYCHLTSDGINFSNGFGQQPGDTVRYYIANHMPCSIQYNPTTALSKASRTISANRQCEDMTSGITYYWNDNNTADQTDDTLVLMAKLGTNTIGDLNTSGFSVTANTVVRYGIGKGDTLTFPSGTSSSIMAQSYGMRRYWKITPTTAPTTAVEVMFPFLPTDTSDVHGSVALPSAPITSYLMYKLHSTVDPNPINGFVGATAGNFTIYTYSTTPTATNWSLSTVGTTQLAHMLVTDLSGGGTGFYSYCTPHVAPVMGTLAPSPCPGATVVYSVTPDGTVTSYTWNVSGTGWSGSSTTGSISMVAGTGAATFTVTANDNCGTGNSTTFSATPLPLANMSISPTSGLCATDATASFNSTILSGGPVTSYTWSVSGTGWSGSSSTSTLVANAGTGIGTITLRGTNNCGLGPVTTYTVAMTNVAPVAPTSIVTPALVCPTSAGSFSTPVVSGATFYTWNVSGTGWSGTGAANAITVNIGTGPGTISVSAGNPCGSSAVYTRTVTTSSGPGAATDITGPSAPCSGTSVTLTTPNVPTASSYQWSVTGSGWSGSSSSNTINVTAGSGNGVISVYPINACGSGTAYTTTITAAPSPSSTFALSSHITPANSSIIAFYTGSAPAGANFAWNFSGGVGTPGTGSGAQTVYWTTPGQYIVFLTVSSGGCSSATADTVDVVHATGIQNVTVQNIDASVVPNPNNGSFDVVFPDDINKPLSVKLFDMQGRMVYHNDYTNTIAKKVPVGSNELAPGTYTLTIYVNESIISKKVTIMK